MDGTRDIVRRVHGVAVSIQTAVTRSMLAALLLCTVVPAIYTQTESPLRLSPDDVSIEQTRDGGYILTVRKRPEIGSVLVTESTEDPDREVPSYALRNPEYHPMNGDERRILDGEFLDRDPPLYFLVDSTPRSDDELGEVFEVFIPYIVEWGYPWGREGELSVLDGTYLNIRTFALPHADYRGAFVDNPFELRVSQRLPEEDTPPSEEHLPAVVAAFSEMAEGTEGETAFAAEPDELPDYIDRIIGAYEGPDLELALVIDTTGSMRESIRAVRENIVPTIIEHLERLERVRVGVVLFRDYFEEYLTRNFKFQEDLQIVQRTVNSARAAGGGDIPEAVFEGLYAAITSLDWQAPERAIILIGDAPPHPLPRGRVTGEMVFEAAREHEIRIYPIALPHP